MCENSKCFTFIWKIKNFSFNSYEKVLCSPSFFVKVMDETKWRLLVHPDARTKQDCVGCYFQREINDAGPDQYSLDFELSFLATDGSVLHSEKYIDKVYRNGDVDFKLALHAKRYEVYLLKKDLFIPGDTLTVRCRMWNKQKPISQPGKCFAKTRIETECRIFVGIIEKFSCIKPGGKYPVCVRSSPKAFFLSSINLCVADVGKLVIEIHPKNCRDVLRYRSKILVKNIFGNERIIGQGEFYELKPHSIPLNHLKDHIMDESLCCLTDDVLTILLKVITATDNTIEEIDEPEYEFCSEEIQESISEVTKMNLCPVEQPTENVRALQNDWISLFREGILCDTKLKTATEIFPAHRAVLSARSSVFKSMFTSEIDENMKNCIDIDDLNADTVSQMLLFMYSSTLEDLQYESVKSLYFAADKFNIVSLKQECSNFLKQNLLQSNSCDTLLLAVKHQDEDLKRAVQEYITKNKAAILFSKEWENLDKNHPQLTTEILNLI